MKIIIDEAADKAYVAIHDDPINTQVTHTYEKHGVLLHWDGHGKLMGVEFSNPCPGSGIFVNEVNFGEDHQPAWDSSTALGRRVDNHQDWEDRNTREAVRAKAREAQQQAIEKHNRAVADARRAAGQRAMTARRARNNRREY